MDRTTARRVAVALLAVVALAAAAATIETTVTGGAGGGFGFGSSGSVGDSPEPVIGVPVSQSAFRAVVICVPFLARPPVVAGLVAVALVGHYLVYRETESLGAVAATAVGVGLPLALLWGLLVACQLESGPIFRFGFFGSDGGALFPSGGGAFGLGGSDGGTVATPTAVFGLALFVALVAAVVLLVASTGDAITQDDETEESESTPPADVREVGRAAGAAADRLEGDADVGNEVYRAWVEMTAHLDVERPASSTPGEFAAAAVDAGMDPDDVDELTHLFEAVRYGDEGVTDARAERAVAALRRIESAYAGEES
ncbi:DUF4129 domain-containing protein [Halobellus clavatus]|uniref:Protein-glutamine gamma-glutamyltransferase-like C-terminal domain-containing protein n=1 Tax=Halobellus clavatus TaxID=660517 RepID=A0A1H3CYF7_9EURY|nr:DUF4129 domain-containing protein [Halobellus clavatus]SDX59070.1 protein of unknown function [Halobellus clavatus]